MVKNNFPVEVWNKYFSKPSDMPEEEWNVRCLLAASYRIFAHLGWVEVIFTHITHRIPGTHNYLINPFGLLFKEITPLNLIKIDSSGEAENQDDKWATNPAGFTLHGIIHANLDDAICVMHTHTDAGSAIACSEGGLSYDTFYGAMLKDQVAYHGFEGITTRSEEAETLIPNVSDKRLVILQNHGLLTYARTVEMALTQLWTLQRACEIQLLQESSGRKMIKTSASATCQSQANSFQLMEDSPTPSLFFNALLREAMGVEENKLV